jgi:hypothetical protein
MRKKDGLRIVTFLALGLLVLGAKCPGVPDTEEVEMTLVTEEYIEFTFQARGDINDDSGTEIIDVNDLRQQLDDAGVSVDRVDTIRVASVLYGVVAYNEAETDRQIVNGSVSIRRGDETPVVLIDDFSAMVYPLLGRLVAAPIDPAGIDFLNLLMADLLEALKDHSVATFAVSGSSSGESQPGARETNFDWRVRVNYHVSGRFLVDAPRF